MLVDSGVGQYISQLMTGTSLSPLLILLVGSRRAAYCVRFDRGRDNHSGRRIADY